MELSEESQSFSNLQLKVMRSALISKRNDIKDKDESTSRFSISRFSFGDSLSISKTLHFAANSDSRSGWDCSIFQCPEDIQGAWLVEAVRVAEPGAEIFMPAVAMNVQDLTINKPITLRGQPGTLLKLHNNSIVIDLRRSFGQVTICELALEYSAGPAQEVASGAAFYLKASGCALEVRDCEFKSLTTDLKVHDVCFWVSSFKASRRGHIQRNSINLSSCSIKGFTVGVRAGVDAKVSIDRCVLASCKGSGVVLTSPLQLKLSQCIIQRCELNGIEIRLRASKNAIDSVLSSRSTSYSKSETTQLIEISGNDISQIGQYGLNIWNDQVCSFPLKVKITSNKLANCFKEAIAIRHISLASLSIKANDCSANKGSHLWLQKVYPSNPASHLTVARNRFAESSAGYGIYVYDSFGTFDDNEVAQNSLGGFIIVGSSRPESQDLSLAVKHCLIHDNGENGLTIMDFSRSSVVVAHTQLYENLQNGLYLVRNHETETLSSSIDSTGPAKSGCVKVEHCNITRNRLNGISMSRVHLSLTETVIKENLGSAVAFGVESKGYFTCEDSKQRAAELISGQVGGTWGTEQGQKRTLCKAQECLLL